MPKPRKPLTKLQNLTLARVKAGLSIEELAEKMGCSPSFLYRVVKNPAKSRTKAKQVDRFIATYSGAVQ